MFNNIRKDLNAAMERDPSARSKLEVFLTYSGFHALMNHRLAHWFHTHKMRLIARIISQVSRFFTGIEIHPAAKIAAGVFIDHGMGVVIGETAEIGENVLIYQGVTLGGTGKETGKRHPTIERNVMISSGAKVLGAITVGENSKIGAGSVVLKDIPSNSTVVGIPGRVVKRHNEKINDLDQLLPDPIMEELTRLRNQIANLEKSLAEMQEQNKSKNNF